MSTTFWYSPTWAALCRCAPSCTLPSCGNLWFLTRWGSGWIWGRGRCFPLPRGLASLYGVRHLKERHGFQPISQKGNYVRRSDWRVQVELVSIQICPGKQSSQGITDTQTSGLSGTVWTAFQPDCTDKPARHLSLPDSDDRFPLKAILGLARTLLWWLSH